LIEDSVEDMQDMGHSVFTESLAERCGMLRAACRVEIESKTKHLTDHTVPKVRYVQKLNELAELQQKIVQLEEVRRKRAAVQVFFRPCATGVCVSHQTNSSLQRMILEVQTECTTLREANESLVSKLVRQSSNQRESDDADADEEDPFPPFPKQHTGRRKDDIITMLRQSSSTQLSILKTRVDQLVEELSAAKIALSESEANNSSLEDQVNAHGAAINTHSLSEYIKCKAAE
jgi:hypothetical protein